MNIQHNWYLNTYVNEVWAYNSNVFDAYECDEIVKIGSALPASEGTVTEDSKIDKTLRQSSVSWIPVNKETEWIFRRITDAITRINNNYFLYDLETIEALQFSTYNKKDFYGYHLDTQYSGAGLPRKLSFTVQLTDDVKYEGGDVEICISDPNAPVKLKRERGCINFFPSFYLHRVSPVTKGVRNSLVGWINGPRFK